MDAVRARSSRRVSKPGLAVFVSGVASMGLEILAGRIVAPQYGSSIYTWGSIITVFLAALSLGYWRGGKLAATASLERLTQLLLGTAAYVAVVVYAHDFLLVWTGSIPLPARYASLPAVILLFGPPTYLLGFVSPYAAELSAKEGIGEASGHVYAVGTIGSILGAGLTTYVLIPELSIGQIGLLFGFLLVGTAVAITLPSLPRRPTATAVFVTALLVVATVGTPAGVDVRGEVVYQTQTPYQELEVIDRGDTRTLYLDGARHSAMDKDHPNAHVFDYTRYFHLPYLMADDPDEIDRVLFVGGGGYTGPKAFAHHYDVTVDVVEIDPEVSRVAKEYFALEESENLTVHTGDGRQYLRETDETYDAIVLDAYRKDKVPFQLTTVEFMELAADRLSEDGVLVANVISAPSGPASDFYRSQYKTMDRAFPQVYSFRTSGLDAVQNVELVATKDAERLSEAELAARNERRDIGLDLSDEVEGYMAEPATGDVPVLRDDRAPVDSLMDPMLGQRYVIEESERENDSETESATTEGEAEAPLAGLEPTASVAPLERIEPIVPSGPSERIAVRPAARVVG